MNVFVTDLDPVRCAVVLDDRRVNKMISESVQLLNNAFVRYGGQAVVSTTHENHRCSRWVRRNRSHYQWLLDHLEALLREFNARYGHEHAYADHYWPLAAGLNVVPDCDCPSPAIETIVASCGVCPWLCQPGSDGFWRGAAW